MKKKFFIPGIIAGLFFIGSFCSSQFTSSVQLSDCTSSNVCSYSDLSNIYSYDDPIIHFYFQTSSSPSSLRGCNVQITQWTNNTYNGLKQYVSDKCGDPVYSINYFYCEYNCYGSVVNYSSSSMPVSSLSPVITGLSNTVSEFIPYIVYIGIGLLSALIGFVAIRRLINRLRNKTLSPFK